MSRLQTEFRRLYLPTGDALADPQGHVRALVLEVARPGDWQALSAVWRGVQAELNLPAPAVAVNGSDGLQLWFSVADAVAPAQAQTFLQGLRRRYLSGMPAGRIALLPMAAASAGGVLDWQQAAAVMAQQPINDCWPAFIAPDLLAALQPIKPADLAAALELLAPAAPPERPETPAAPPAAPAVQAGTSQPAGPAQRFLLAVMNDTSVPMALRIEAAKALLPWDRGA